MKVKAKPLTSGTVTSPRGFLAGAAYAGLKTGGDNILDLGMLFSEVPCAAAGLSTTNRVKAAPLALSQERLLKKRAQVVVVNSGCANACTGAQGLADATEMASLAAAKLGIAGDEVLVASTGVIGVPLAPSRSINPTRWRSAMTSASSSRSSGSAASFTFLGAM